MISLAARTETTPRPIEHMTTNEEVINSPTLCDLKRCGKTEEASAGHELKQVQDVVSCTFVKGKRSEERHYLVPVYLASTPITT